jgi:hypothetical protein
MPKPFPSGELSRFARGFLDVGLLEASGGVGVGVLLTVVLVGFAGADCGIAGFVFAVIDRVVFGFVDILASDTTDYRLSLTVAHSLKLCRESVFDAGPVG